MNLLSLSILLANLLQVADRPITNAFNNPATTSAEQAVWITRHQLWLVMPFILLAEILLVVVIFKFRNKGDGRKPATFHENVALELTWTILPIIALTLVVLPSFKVLKFMERSPQPQLNINVVGHQFFWEYKYPDLNIDIANQPLVVPADEVVDLDLTSVDVIHGWYVPAFGIQEDALPGRVTTLWFKAKAGTYKGQCTQLCGTDHGQMFIDVQVLPREQFDAWVQAHQSQPAAGADQAQPAAGADQAQPAAGADQSPPAGGGAQPAAPASPAPAQKAPASAPASSARLHLPILRPMPEGTL